MAWPKGKKRDPNQKHGGGWSAKKNKENMINKEKTAPQVASEEATVIETKINTPEFPNANVEEPSAASTLSSETHANFISNSIMPAEEQDKDFLKAMNLPLEDSDKYKYNEEYNTFAGNVKPRGEHANIKTDPSIKEVPEYSPPLNPPLSKEPSKPVLPSNPAINDLSAGDKEKAAAALVDVILNLWTFIKMAAGSKAGINIDKIKDLAAQSKIDLNAQIPIGGNEYVSLSQMIESFNAQVPNGFIVTDEFKNKVREPMIREFVKRGIGLTDLQLLSVYWGIEIATTGWNFWDMKKQGNKIIENQIELFKLLKENQQKPSAKPMNTSNDNLSSEKKKETTTEQPTKEFKEPEEGSNKDL